MYHPAILLITAVRAVQLAVTSYMGWNKGLEVKLYKHKHEIYLHTLPLFEKRIRSQTWHGKAWNIEIFLLYMYYYLLLTSFPWEHSEHLSKQTPRLDRRREESNWSNKPEITCLRWFWSSRTKLSQSHTPVGEHALESLKIVHGCEPKR